MAYWEIIGNVTLPPEADRAIVKWIGSNNSGGDAGSVSSSDGGFDFGYNDADGSSLYLLFILADSVNAPIDAQPIAHGPYDPSVVGSPL